MLAVSAGVSRVQLNAPFTFPVQSREEANSIDMSRSTWPNVCFSTRGNDHNQRAASQNKLAEEELSKPLLQLEVNKLQETR